MVLRTREDLGRPWLLTLMNGKLRMTPALRPFTASSRESADTTARTVSAADCY